MAGPIRRDHDSLCEYHQELAENQAEIAAHLLWLRGAGRWVVGLMGTCLMVLVGIGSTIVSYGWSLSLASQTNQLEIARLASQVTELRQADKDVCDRLMRIESGELLPRARGREGSK